MEVFGPGVEATNSLLLVTEAGANRLGDVQHVGDVVPAVGVVCSREVIIDEARSILLKEANERVRSRSSVQPQGEGVCSRVIARFKEPEEDVNLEKC